MRQNLDFTPESHPSLGVVRNNLKLTHGIHSQFVCQNLGFAHKGVQWPSGTSLCGKFKPASTKFPVKVAIILLSSFGRFFLDIVRNAFSRMWYESAYVWSSAEKLALGTAAFSGYSLS